VFSSHIDIIFFFLFKYRDLELFAYLVNHKASVIPPAVSLALSQSFSSSRRRFSVFCKVLLYRIKNLNSALWSLLLLAIQWKKKLKIRNSQSSIHRCHPQFLPAIQHSRPTPAGKKYIVQIQVHQSSPQLKPQPHRRWQERV